MAKKKSSKEKILNGLKKAVEELNEIKAGKRKAKSLKEFLKNIK